MAFLCYQDGRLCFGPRLHDLEALSEKIQTPCYLYEWSGIESRYLTMKRAFGEKTTLHFAMKSNSHPEILERLAHLGSGVDVVSGGEMELALKCGFPAERIIFSGVGKTKGEIRRALEVGIEQINIESEAELVRVLKISQELGKRASIALRLNPDVNPETHPYITTGFRENKFGLERGTALRCLDLIRTHPEQFNFRGLTLHIGSQLFDLADYSDALDWLLDFVAETEKSGLTVHSLDLGGGLGIFYESDRHPDEENLLKSYADMVLKKMEGRPQHLQLEPGRWIVAHSGVLLTRIQYAKQTPHKNFLIVDTGMHHLIRPALYQARHRILPLKEQTASDFFDVVGPICESSDFLGQNIALPRLDEDDLLVIADAGAYGYEMGSEYNSQTRPGRILLE